MKHQSDQLFTALSYAYTEYINTQLDLIGNSLYFSLPYFDEETHQIQLSLQQLYCTLPQILSANATSKEKCSEQLLTFRPILERKYRTLIAYERELTHEVTKQQQRLSAEDDALDEMGYAKEDADQIDYKALGADCKDFIFKATSEPARQKNAALLLPYIPIKLTQANFLDYVAKSLKHIELTEDETSVTFLNSVLKQLFDGRLSEGYGTDFKDLVESIAEVKSLDNLTDLFEEANMLNETFETLRDLLGSLYHMICALSTLLIFDQLDFTDITDMDATFSDFYYSVKNIISDAEHTEAILPTLKERVSERLDVHQKAFKALSAKAQVDPYFNLIQTYLSMKLENLFGFNMKRTLTPSPLIETGITAFIHELGSALANLPTLDRRLRMQYLISNIPFVMSSSNFDTYLSRAFAHTNPVTNLLVALQLTNILEQEGHLSAPESDTPVIESTDEEDDEAAAFLRQFDTSQDD